MKDRSYFVRWLVVGFALLILGAVLSLKFGAAQDLSVEWVVKLRAPRLLMAISVGIALAVSGAVLQSVFQNPLCDPYTLGVSSGAALGSVMWTAFFGAWGSSAMFGGLLGSLSITALLLALSSFRRGSALTVLIVGVLATYLCSSLINIWLSTTDASGAQSTLFWLLGDLSRAELKDSFITFAGVIWISFMIYRDASQLDALMLGEEVSRSLGIDTFRLRRRMIFLSSLLVTLSVSSCGMIGFVGAVVPNVVRLLVGVRHRWVLVLVAVWGAVALVFGDVVARTFFSPVELSVGAVTAVFGAPALAFFVMRASRRSSV